MSVYCGVVAQFESEAHTKKIWFIWMKELRPKQRHQGWICGINTDNHPDITSDILVGYSKAES
jgi:hypothetical protein